MYHFHDPELMSVGMLLKLRGKRVIWDIHEDLPRQILTKDWIAGGLRGHIARATEVMEALCERNVDAIVAATPAIARRFTLEKTVTVQNLPTLDKPTHTKASPYMQKGRILTYVGGMSGIRGAREMVAAMNLLPASLEAQLVLAGVFASPKLEAELQQTPGWERVQFVGWKSQSEVNDLLAQSRVGLVLFHPAPNHTEAQPNKLFEYMRAGIPVIASNFPLWRRIVEKERCGLLVNPLEPRAIAQSMQWILENPQQAEAMGTHGQEAVSARYNWGTEARELLELYGRLVK
jgi:glycosyltransferase involved in cell wall biosynthesis